MALREYLFCIRHKYYFLQSESLILESSVRSREPSWNRCSTAGLRPTSVNYNQRVESLPTRGDVPPAALVTARVLRSRSRLPLLRRSLGRNRRRPSTRGNLIRSFPRRSGSRPPGEPPIQESFVVGTQLFETERAPRYRIIRYIWNDVGSTEVADEDTRIFSHGFPSTGTDASRKYIS